MYFQGKLSEVVGRCRHLDRNYAFIMQAVRSKLSCNTHFLCSYSTGMQQPVRLVVISPRILQSSRLSVKFRNIFSNSVRYKSVLQSRNSKLVPRTKQEQTSSFVMPKASELKRLLSLAKPERWTLAGAICLLAISSTITMAVPFCLGKVIDVIYSKDSDPQQSTENLKRMSLMLLGVFLIGGLCNFGRVYLMAVSGYRITQALRQRVFGSIVKQEVAFFDRNKTGELINRLSSDTSVVSQAVTSNVSDGLRSTAMATAGVSMMFYMSPQLALVGLAIVPPLAGVAIVYGRFVRQITKAVQDSLASANQVAEERISGIRTVKAFSQEERECESYSEKLHHVLQLAYRESFVRGIFFGLTGLSGNVIILSVLYYGGVMVGQSALSVGELSAFLLYAAYTAISLGGLTSFYSELSRGLGASTRLWEIVDRQPAIPVRGGLTPVAAPVGNIVFEDVHFCYPVRRESPGVFRGLSLKVPAGQITALVGASGSGKSTIASLLLRLYDPDGGRILLDGEDTRHLDPQWLRSHIGTVSQEPVLFSCSVRENILYGANDPASVTEDQLKWAAQEANALAFIQKQLPEGFDTPVGERGVALSGGQKQRVAIARALIKNPRILVLDEATSALDAESEHLVQEALERVMKGRTVLTIAHRLSTIRNADQIAVLDQGKIIEQGSYEELMALDVGAFRKLVQHQTFAS
ncbi:ATP-binding cassette sub-family B member 10, mitochondrial-like [Schistocerca gregaria]|uniref:ATP-binding cassette sub-family B member 10, mitochondrial-like n=1 Tax=Schistocerca gregaria TaxID=7010 RepID=UPI00211E1DB9|nr:ATP-binding cassette sub-family B member 10, mitochondrial-like [Schistocerca gregaria]